MFHKLWETRPYIRFILGFYCTFLTWPRTLHVQKQPRKSQKRNETVCQYGNAHLRP